MTGVAKNTVTRLLAGLGTACAAYQSETLRNLPCKRLQCDEIWSFVGATDKNVPGDAMGQFGVGSVWTWTESAPTRSCACRISSRRATQVPRTSS